jgi:hypothetical protein
MLQGISLMVGRFGFGAEIGLAPAKRSAKVRIAVAS